ncbi:MAG: hypothetical protein NDI73_05670 [Desulfuromonadales bacterium]|nr:hypothetical protein [Desulfuromonadales bacterium]
MRGFYFWAGAALIVWLCLHYSFWIVFGWAYAAVSVALIFVCFTHKRRQYREPPAERLASLQAQFSED